MKKDQQSIGLISTGLYLPEKRMTGREIAQAAGLPLDVVEKKMGIVEKPIPGEGDHPCEMGVRAAKQAIERAGVDPAEIDLVIYIGEEYKEYPVWTAGIKLQQGVGAVNAWAFDTALRCGTAVLGFKLAKSLMLADHSLHTVLLAGGYRNVDLVNYQNPRTRFLFNLSAGGGAVLLRKGWNRNEVLASHIITDGSFSEDVIVPAGGTKLPASAETVRKGLHSLDVCDPQGMKERLEKKSLHNFFQVIRQSLQKSGLSERDIDYLGILHMKRSAHDAILHELGLSREQTVYLDHYGHMGQIDQILSLELGLRKGKIKAGDIVVLVSAGIGYAWGATTIRWG
ncbi:3-oxoacyl-ACP synthase [Paenactinomyces guangxiensis]|uniref:3-oxoacyl-ACP synthase n=1 Tax=Paenactinomyces guangxiensis TaxID=1490290 RepID=A0A7W1WSM3_9BACL|nr:3-oxoacyl-ACP synthase [Paenactinomyces guangxiensis]MBA4495224.1 3-oxoacyl-ACP synthase [Paenactinomyces guangxiensis]MBH8592308.1 3-oxoacyl-ACP synthase [Paenactinomyces guangxiensis]